MALIKCPSCGGNVSDKAPVCPHCGHVMVNEGASVPPTAPQAPVPPVSPVLSTAPEQPPMPGNPNPRKNRGPVWTIVIFLVLLLAGGGTAYYFYAKNKADAAADAEAARLDSLAAIEAAEAARLDSIRQDSIRRNTLVDFDCFDFIVRSGQFAKAINFDAKLIALGFERSPRKKTYEGEGDYDEWVKSYKTIYTYSGDSGNIKVVYDVTEYELFDDFSWTITFSNPKQREKFIQSLYEFGYKPGYTETDSKGNTYMHINTINSNPCTEIGWNIHDGYITSWLGNC